MHIACFKVICTSLCGFLSQRGQRDSIFVYWNRCTFSSGYLGDEMNKRKLKFEDFEISDKRYKELCGFCEQYPEWKEKLVGMTYIRAVGYDDSPKPSNHDNSDTTAKHALRALAMKRKVEMIERCAKTAGGDLAEYIIRSACYEESYEYLYGIKQLHIGRSAFYEKRRYFFYLLDIEKKKKDKEFIN